jgi:hypothetical protein
MQIAWLTNMIFNDIVPSNEIFDKSLRIAMEDEMAIPQRICSIKNTSIWGAILFTVGTLTLWIVHKVTNYKLNDIKG